MIRALASIHLTRRAYASTADRTHRSTRHRVHAVPDPQPRPGSLTDCCDCAGPIRPEWGCLCSCHQPPRGEAASCAGCATGAAHCYSEAEGCNCPCPLEPAEPALDTALRREPATARVFLRMVLRRGVVHRESRKWLERQSVQPLIWCGGTVAVPSIPLPRKVRSVLGGSRHTLRMESLPAGRMEPVA